MAVTEPGGRYEVQGRIVDSEGRPIVAPTPEPKKALRK